MKRLTIYFIFVNFIFHNAFSQDTVTIDDYYIDFAVPDLSSLGMLGIENDEIVRPGNLKEFAAALSNYIDSDGSLKPALAMEWSFMKTFTGKDPIKWRNTFQPRNLALSLATTEQDSLGLRLGVGLKWVPVDKSDPLGDEKFYQKMSELIRSYYANESFRRLDDFNRRILGILGYNDINTMNNEEIRLLAAVTEVLNVSSDSVKAIRRGLDEGSIKNLDSTFHAKLNRALSANNVDLSEELKDIMISYYIEIILDSFSDDYTSVGDYINKIILKEKENYKMLNWNAFAWEISAGWVGHSETVTYNDFKSEKFSFFSGASFPTWKNNKNKIKGQLIGQIKYDFDVSGDSIDFSRFSIGAKHLLGNSDNRFSMEFLYSDSETTLLESDETLPVSYLRYTVGAELKLMDGSWLELAFGGQKFFEGKNEENAILASLGFKHAIQNKRRYDIK